MRHTALRHNHNFCSQRPLWVEPLIRKNHLPGWVIWRSISTQPPWFPVKSQATAVIRACSPGSRPWFTGAHPVRGCVQVPLRPVAWAIVPLLPTFAYIVAYFYLAIFLLFVDRILWFQGQYRCILKIIDLTFDLINSLYVNYCRNNWIIRPLRIKLIAATINC